MGTPVRMLTRVLQEIMDVNYACRRSVEVPFRARRWAFKLSPPDWAELAHDMRMNAAYSTFGPPPPDGIWRMDIWGVEIIRDCTQEDLFPLPVMLWYGESG